MKKPNRSKFLLVCSNTTLILLAILIAIYSIASLLFIHFEAKAFFNTANKDYETCFGKKYIHEDSYLSDIACMKMEIATDIITKSTNLKNQYFDSITNKTNTNETNNSGKSNVNEAETYSVLKNSLSDIQDYNNAIQYNTSSLPLHNNCNSLYSALNYITYGSDALLQDIVNFTTDQELLTLAADKDIQQIHVMANISTNLVLNLDKQIYFYKYAILISIFILLGTILNIYRLSALNKNRRKRRNIQIR